MLKHSIKTAGYFNKTILPSMRAFSQARIPSSHNLLGLIQHYQRNGHLKAKLDPLGLRK
jgi:2-oxoglutarate dehydrogenase complex dehydrogenase (E1) component-like enzyme